VLAAWYAQRLEPKTNTRFSLLGLLLFLPFFAWESIRGGIDVARRVLAPSPELEPGYQDFRMRLTDTRAQLLFVNTVSLLPGTLAADLNGSTVRVHALDVRANIRAELQKLELAVARIYRDDGLS
jgi:multicomponent Na+:H+ antiporter subunit E